MQAERCAMRDIAALSAKGLCRIRLFCGVRSFLQTVENIFGCSKAGSDTCNLWVTWHASAVDCTPFPYFFWWLVANFVHAGRPAFLSSHIFSVSDSELVVHAEFILLIISMSVI
jgi:hypothetical protein